MRVDVVAITNAEPLEAADPVPYLRHGRILA